MSGFPLIHDVLRTHPFSCFFRNSASGMVIVLIRDNPFVAPGQNLRGNFVHNIPLSGLQLTVSKKTSSPAA